MTPPVTAVAVVGSLNVDFVIHADKRPAAGETLLGRSTADFPGGKGANQAISAARVAVTALVGATGDDPAGRMLLGALSAAGVDVTPIRAVDSSTGVAVITVTPDGENSIIVIPGANSHLTAEDVIEHLDRLNPAVVVAQLETPLATVEAACDWAERHHRRWVFNPSPINQIPERLIARADPLIVNIHEARALSTSELTAPDELAHALTTYARSVIVTAGANGSYICTDHSVSRVPATRVHPADTTGAGDEYAGRIAAELSRGKALLAAAEAAAKAAAAIVERPRELRTAKPT